jgi:hypothetical protein
MKKTDLKNTIKEEIKKVLMEETSRTSIPLIRGALNQIEENGKIETMNAMLRNLTDEEARQFNLLVQKGIGKEIKRIPTNSPAADPRLTPGTTD